MMAGEIAGRISSRGISSDTGFCDISYSSVR